MIPFLLQKQLIDKLRLWIEKIEEQITMLVIRRYMFWELQKIIKSNPNINKTNSFYDMIASTYADSAVMAVRRLVDNDRKSISFTNLLDKLIKNAKAFNRGWYISLWGNPPEPAVIIDNIQLSMREAVIKQANDFAKNVHFKRANAKFDEFAGKVKNYIDIKRVEKDKRHLKLMAIRIQHYADRQVAHHDKRGPKGIPTFQELDCCVDIFEGLCLKYLMLLKASAPTTLLPTWQYDWKEVFYYPWIINKKEKEDGSNFVKALEKNYEE